MDPLASLPPSAMGTTLLPTAPTLQTPTLALASPLKATPAPSAVGLGLSTLSAAEPSVKLVTSPHELTQFVDTLLNELDAKFDEMTTDLLSRLGSLSTQADSLEASIGDLLTGAPTSTNPSAIETGPKTA